MQALLHGWKMLAIELTNYMTNDVRAQNMLMDVAKNCLIANGRTRLPETIFVQLSETRADLALVILQRLIEVGCKEETALALLPTSWNLIMNHDESFEQAMTSGDASYYRTLLKLLFLALRFHAGRKPGPKVTTVSQLKDLVASGVSAPKDKDEAEEDEDAANDVDTDEKGTPSQIGLQIIDKIVAQGFRDLVRAIHEKLSESVPEDLALITAILQACLLIPGIQFCHPQILSVMTKTEAPRLATTLFSWSDKLAVEGDPIYGELSMLFLLELSSIPQLAEQLAIEGVLGHISSANITGYIRRANVSPLADGAGPQRCYSIWVKAILPLLLNILDAVGSSIAVEVALFLNQFPNLLKQSTAAFESQEGSRTVTQSKYLTYTSVSEVHSLSLILFILSTFRDQMMGITDVPDVQWDGAAVIENVEFWLNARVVLRERILPLGPREAEMAKQKPLSGALKSQNRLEEKIVEELEGIKVVLSGN
jgi:nuclear pore complex protein Nup188